MISENFQNELMEIVKISKDYIYKYDKEYNYSQDTLNGFCACISYITFKKYQHKLNIKFAGNNQHCFLILNNDTILDLSPSQFNGDYELSDFKDIETSFRIYNNENYEDTHMEIWLENFVSNDEKEIKTHLSYWEEVQNPFYLIEKNTQWFNDLLKEVI